MNSESNQSVHDVIKKIRRAAGEHMRERTGHGTSNDSAIDGWSLPGFFRPPDLDLSRQSYDAGELLQYRDQTFITVAYQALLKREPDPGGLENYLKWLRKNPSDKLKILATLRYSAEGQDRNVAVKGLEWEKIKLQLQKIPLVGKGIRVLFSLNKPRGVKKELACQQGRLDQLVEETGQALGVVTTWAQTRLDAKADNDDLLKKVDVREMNTYLRPVGHVLDMINEIHPPRQNAESTPPGGDAYSGAWLDELYLSFEDAFRGPGQLIRRHMEAYLPSLRDVTDRVPVSDASPPGLPPGCAVLDLGCGRGEFLELLAENNIAAMGIDSNRLMVQQAQKSGHHVRQEDIFGFLAELPPECLAAVSAFHVVEHFPFERQLQLIDQIRRVLLPGGMILLETPNPCNILVGAIDFYRDPTHLRPIHPDTLLFLARSRGFAPAAIYFPEESEENGLVLEDAAKTRFTDLQDYITVARDYALMAYKF